MPCFCQCLTHLPNRDLCWISMFLSDPVRKNTEKVAAAVKEVEKSADRSTVLAANRTIFAAERTYAAWVRTGLTSLAAGVAPKQRSVR